MNKKVISLLLCLILLIGTTPAGVFTLSAAAERVDSAVTGSGNTKDDPIIVNTYDQLKYAFDRTASSDTALYVKLNHDVSYSGYECGTLVTKGSALVLDLAGYTISVEDSSNCSFPVIYGQFGGVTITDSTRYDTSGSYGHLVNGKIDYLYTLPGESTSVLVGNITVKGGWFVNRCHSSDGKNTNSIYNSSLFGYGTYHTTTTDPGARLTMIGGVFEADVPVRFGSSDYYSLINGGRLRVKGTVGIQMTLDSSSKNFPIITDCTMNHYSSHDSISAFDIRFEPSFEDKHTAADAIAVWHRIVSDDTYAYVDDVLLARGNHGVYYNAVGGLIGPLFKKSYVLTPITTVTHINLTIAEPAAGEAMPYHAVGSYLDGYETSDYTGGTWSSGVQWTDGKVYTDEYPVGSTFEVGKSYAVFIKVSIAQKGFLLADEDSLSATINGEKALFYRSGENEYVVYHTFSIEKYTVSNASVTITAPKAGELPSYHAAVPSGKGYTVENGYSTGSFHNGVAWMHENGSAMAQDEKFEYGKKYIVLIYIAPLESYQFAGYESMTATVNGNQSTVIPYSSVRYGITYAFKLPDLIDSMSLTIPSTKAGEQMKWSALAPDGADYEVDKSSSGLAANGVIWYKDDTVITPGKTVYFEEGVTYKMTISVKPKDTDSFRFAAAEDMSAAVNGEAATVSRPSDTKATVVYTFAASKESSVGYLLGDTDADGSVTIIDATTIQRQLAGIATQVYNKEAADADGDGSVTVVDATAIQRHLAGLPSNQNIGKPM